MNDNTETPEEKARREALTKAAIAFDETKPSIEKRRRAQAAANTEEAIRRRNDFDPFTGE